MKRPLVALSLIFCIGIYVASFINICFLFIYSLAFIFLTLNVLSLKKGLRFEIFLFCLIFILGILSLKNSWILAKCHISRYASYKNSCSYIIKGFVASPPVLKKNKLYFIFRVKEIQFNNVKYRSCGNILVYIKGKKNLHYAEELVLSSTLYRPYSFASLKSTSYRDYLYNQGIFALADAKLIERTQRLDTKLIFKRFAFRLKSKMEDIIFKYTSSVHASILAAMILGEKRHIPPLVYNSMIKSGTVHILVVSGFNVGIVSFVILLLLRLIRISRLARFYAASILLVIYCFVTGASNPVVRATVMAIVFMFAYFVKRDPDIFNSSALAALFILIFNPRQLLDIGFQLSFASVISIAYLYPKLKSLLHTDSLKVKYLKFVIDSGLVSFSAWLGTLGFIAYYFKIISPVTVLANIFIVPIASFITLAGFSLILIELICSPLAPFLAYSSELAVLFLLKLNAFLIKLPLAFFYLS